MAKMNFIVFIALLCVVASDARKAKFSFRSGRGSVRRPNIIFILLDDMDTELGSPNVMEKTQKILRQEGADFVNAFVTTPMCCPSRSSILTGKYAHNHNTFTNNLNCSSPSWRKGPERKSYARYLELAGYVTGHFGKYLNEYDGNYVPVGWNKWEGLMHNSRFYNYTIRHNTYKERHRMSYKEDYFTDFITNRSISFIRRTMATRPDSPFLAVVSHAAPHGPETSAPQYSTAFPHAKAPRFPNWNFISLDKQWILREKQPMDAQKKAFVDLLHRRRLQTLLSVDDSVARIFRTLQSLGIDNETYIFLTSDHGYHLGQFGLVKGKSMPFESDIRVPFYVRGPVIPKNIRMKEMVLNIDLAPTFLDIAGVSVPKDMDGSSIMKLFRKTKDGRPSKRRMHVVWRDTILIERSRGWRRTKNMLESSSRNKLTSEGKSRNKTQTNKKRKMIVLENICSKTKHQSPCQPMQQWECVTVDGRPRLRKCRKTGSVQATTTPTTRPQLSPAPTTPVKMCVCMKPRPGTQTNENQGDMHPYNDELLKSELDYLSAKELSRRKKRTRYSFINDRPRRNRNEFNARRYYKELARAKKLQNRRAKSKMFQRIPFTGAEQKPNTSEALMGPGVQEVVEEKLGKLKEKIWEIKMRLGALRDRKKKLLQISARDRLIEYPCPCSYDNNTKPEGATATSMRNKGKDGDDYDDDDDGYDDDADNDDDDDDSEDDEASEISPIKRRNKQPKALSRKAEAKKKKKVKTSKRRTKCSNPGLNCFYQTNDHWKLPPLWTGGEFCFCPNAANNSYWCLRTINATHNFLYCEFITHFLEFFDLNQDPYQLYNVIEKVSPAVLSQLHKQLERMKGCKGGNQCNHYHGKKYVQVNATSTPFTTPPLTSTSKQTTETTRMTTDGEFTVSNNKNIAVLNKPNAIHLPTMLSNLRTSSERTSSPLPSEGVSAELGNRSESFVNTPENAVDSSETTEFSSITTLAPTELRTTETSNSRPEGSGNRLDDGESTVATSVVTSEETTSTTNVFPFTTLAPTKARIKTEKLKPTEKVKTFVEKEEKKEGNKDEKETQGVASTPKITDVTSKTMKSSSNVFAFTTSAPSEARVKTDRLTTKSSVKRRKEKTSAGNGGREKDNKGEKEKRKSSKTSRKSKKKSSKNLKSSPLPTNSTFPDKTTEIPRNISDDLSKNTKSKSKNEKITYANVEKPTESVITPTTDDMPTELVITSEREPSSSISTILPTSLATLSNEGNKSKLDLIEHSTIKPTRRKTARRRKNGKKEGKETLKKSKKLRKTKKKLGKGVLFKNNTSSSGDNEDVLKLSKNQTLIETTSEPEREGGSTKKGNNPSTEISKKRSKKPSGKRLNRNSKKRSRKPSKSPTPSQISEKGVAGGGVVSPVEGGGADISPSDP